MSKKKPKISNEEINKVVSAALRKKSRQIPTMNTKEQFSFNGKDYILNFTRKYHRGSVSLCNPAACNAGGGCCHLRKVNGIDICYDASDNFDLFNVGSEGGLIWDINEEMENKIFRVVKNVLLLIEESSPKPQENR